MTTLPSYLIAQSITQAEFARRIGASQGFISKLCKGSGTPSLELAARIEWATKGEVTAISWVKEVREWSE
ncbi:helix-turn-helix domain-containing protein [Mangrovicoccus algicola]|uniref:Helix-turn-helix transcriptional regulator n=1 Tax=Mangrovicoccus algicola TaxID=2771008 RepID=A0A8J7CW89_9RHOB|nr:helix-turn-helix transcriptional regulator [Mangrovicoccus algicola]